MLRNGQTKRLRDICEMGHPAVVADLLSTLNSEEVWAVLGSASPRRRAEIFVHLPEALQVDIVTSLTRSDIAHLLTDMPPDERTDLFKQLPRSLREAVLPALAQAEREDIRRLSSYEEGTAGAVMTSDYATLAPELTVAQALDHLRAVAPDKETVFYTYVVGADRKLLGFVSLKDLIIAPREARVAEIMHRDVIFARADEDQEEAARRIQKYDLLALPVVDARGVLVGIITHDDALDVITQEHTEDMEKLMAIGGSHRGPGYLSTSAWVHFRNRAGWLVGLAALGLASGTIIRAFQSILSRMLILALYMPMLADTGGNAGSQSATVVVRALALREVSCRDFARVLWKELKTATMLAALLAFLSWGKVMFLSHGVQLPPGYTLPRIAMAIAVALGIQVVSATLIGALLPLAVAALNCDPALVASPALTTLVDITGLAIYFTTAKLLLGL